MINFFFILDITWSVGRVHQSNGHASTSGSEHGDRKFRNVRRNNAHNITLFESHTGQCATEATDRLTHRVVSVSTSGNTAFLLQIINY